jgi:transcriptional regulator with XRE-family HTH domain
MSAPVPGPFYLDPDLFRVALGDALRARREERGMSQDAVAQQIGTSQARIWEVEKGIHVIRWDRLLALCEALSTSPGAVMTRAEIATRDAMRGEAVKPPDQT